uniref:Uncharacterized protein n=1 Tax=Aegilops tauschii subsp. strangulata TaxID=200361 RepID=A0A453BJJ6_AEGTS
MLTLVTSGNKGAKAASDSAPADRPSSLRAIVAVCPNQTDPFPLQQVDSCHRCSERIILD